MTPTIRLASLFLPSASLSAAPDDVIIHILTFVSPLEVLSIRRCCRRLYHISNLRFVWLHALRKLYSRRALWSFGLPSVTSHLTNTCVEQRATRPFRFLHALANIGSALFKKSVFELEETLTPPAPETVDEAHWKSGAVCLYLVPGGRWLCFLFNHLVDEGVEAVLMVVDLWRDRTVLRHAFTHSAFWAHFQFEDSASRVVVVVGFDRTRITAPYFAAFIIAISQLETDAVALVRISALKVERTPRSCSVYRNTVAAADRNGSVTLWDWKDEKSATMLIYWWPRTKGQIFMMSEELFATFDPASSAITVHKTPQLRPLHGRPTPNFPLTVPEDEEEALEAALDAFPPVGAPSRGVQRFRLPSRDLQVTLPTRVPASSFYQDNSPFPDPFLAYFVFSHSRKMSDLHMGLIPRIHHEVEPADGEAQAVTHDDTGSGLAQSEPTTDWLSTWRCTDSSRGSVFSRESRPLWCSSLDHSVAVLRSNDEGDLELFTTSALHSKPASTSLWDSRSIGWQPHYHPSVQFRHGPMPLHPIERNFLFPPNTHLRTPSAPSSRLIGTLPPAYDPQMGLHHRLSAFVGALQPASSVSAIRTGASSSQVPEASRALSSVQRRSTKRVRLALSTVPLRLQPLPSVSPPPSYSSSANPHLRTDSIAEGDSQVIGYRPNGEVRAATVDDVSGKIALVIEKDGCAELVILDYGWDFWKPDASQEVGAPQ